MADNVDTGIDEDEEIDTDDEPEEPADWSIMGTGQDAIEALCEFVFTEQWTRDVRKRKPGDVMAVEVKEQLSIDGERESIWSHTLKNQAAPTAMPDAFGHFLNERLESLNEPLRLIWTVFRSPKPQLRNFDSNRRFYLVNAEWRRRNGGRSGGGETGFLPSPLPGPPQAPAFAAPSMFSGPSPLGFNPQQPPTVSIHHGAGVPLAGIHGDIGGTGLKELVYAVTDSMSRTAAMVERNQMFYADLVARMCQQQVTMMQEMGKVLLAHPETEGTRHRLDHEYRMKQLEEDVGLKTVRSQETSGVVKELGGKLLDNPALAGALMGIAKRFGVEPGDIAKLMQGED